MTAALTAGQIVVTVVFGLVGLAMLCFILWCGTQPRWPRRGL